ncbi:Uncharacterised protein [Sphingobacterium multivorum]|nr:hypothetical protein L950_0220820 [Sphingobacterium sp. IITKGP-BTPF85]SUI97994.1 Uncharacterised protein [Sphingobacterium multivorum]
MKSNIIQRKKLQTQVVIGVEQPGYNFKDYHIKNSFIKLKQ